MRYWVDDDGYIIYDDDDSRVIVCEMYPEHVQALTRIIESHDDLLAACEFALDAAEDSELYPLSAMDKLEKAIAKAK